MLEYDPLPFTIVEVEEESVVVQNTYIEIQEAIEDCLHSAVKDGLAYHSDADFYRD